MSAKTVSIRVTTKTRDSLFRIFPTMSTSSAIEHIVDVVSENKSATSAFTSAISLRLNEEIRRRELEKPKPIVKPKPIEHDNEEPFWWNWRPEDILDEATMDRTPDYFKEQMMKRYKELTDKPTLAWGNS